MCRRILWRNLWKRYKHDKCDRFRHLLDIKATNLPIITDFYSANYNVSFPQWALVNHIPVKMVEHAQWRVLIHSHANALMTLKETPAKSVSKLLTVHQLCSTNTFVHVSLYFVKNVTQIFWFFHRAPLSTWQKDGRSSRPLLCFSFRVWRSNLPILYQRMVFIWQSLRGKLG